MKTRALSKWTAILFFGLSLAILTSGFYGNAWRAAGKKWFVDWQKFHEHLVIARLVQSRQAGMFSYGGLLGFGDITTWNVDSSVIEHEYSLFLNGGQFSAYWSYNSVPGFEAIPFSLIERYSGMTPASNIKLFRLTEAILSAAVLSMFLVWILGEFGLAAALAGLLFMTLSEWMTLFGANFYWNLWAFYLPLVGLCFYLQHSDQTGQHSRVNLFLILAVTILIKCLFNGFEFISTALIVPFSALVYYGLRSKWNLSVFISRFGSAAAGALSGAGLGLGVLALQIAARTGSFGQAVTFIQYTSGKRSFGDPAQYSGIEADSLRANLLNVLGTYINGRAINLNGVFQVNIPGLEISYLQVFILFGIATLLFFWQERYRGGFSQPAKARALLATTWFSALAPLSWFVLFKAHSYIHTQLNFITWQMPFTLFGCVLCGYVLANLLQRKASI